MDFNYVFFQAILHVGAPYIKNWGIFVTLGYTPCWIIMIWPLSEAYCFYGCALHTMYIGIIKWNLVMQNRKGIYVVQNSDV